MKHLDKTTWQRVKFGDVARSLNTSQRNPQAAGIERYVGMEHIEPGSLHIRSWGTVADGTTFTRTFQPGQVLFGKRRAYQRKAAVAHFAGLCSGDILVLEAKSDRLLPELLPFLVHSDGFFDQAVRTSAGSLSPRTKFKDLADYEFLLPPRDQQAPLAELLWAADEVGEGYESTLEVGDNLLELLRDQMLFPEDNTLEDWTYQKLSEAVEIASGQVDPKLEAYRDLVQIGAEHIESKTGRIIGTQTADELNLISGKYQFDESHVLYSKIRPYLRKVANPNFSGLCSADMYPLKGKNNSIDKNYLFHFLLSKKFTENIMKHQVRTGMPKVNRVELGSVIMPIPPVKTQLMTVAKLESIQTFLNDMVSLRGNAASMKQAIINRIFSA